MKGMERVLRALANRRRLAIVKHLKANGEAPVGEIAAAIKLSFRATSKHLGILSAVDIVEREQRSLQVFYRLVSPLPPVARAIVTLV